MSRRVAVNVHDDAIQVQVQGEGRQVDSTQEAAKMAGTMEMTYSDLSTCYVSRN